MYVEFVCKCVMDTCSNFISTFKKPYDMQCFETKTEKC